MSTGMLQTGDYKIVNVGTSGSFATIEGPGGGLDVKGSANPNVPAVEWHVDNHNGLYLITSKQYGQCAAYTTATPSAGDAVKTRSGETYRWVIKETSSPGEYIIYTAIDDTLCWGLSSQTADVRITATTDSTAKWSFQPDSSNSMATGTIQTRDYKIVDVGNNGAFATVGHSVDTANVTGSTDTNAPSVVWHVENNNGRYTVKSKLIGQCVAYTTATPSVGDAVKTMSGVTYEWVIKETSTPGEYLIYASDNDTLYWGLSSKTSNVLMTATSDNNAKWTFQIDQTTTSVTGALQTNDYKIINVGANGAFATIGGSGGGVNITGSTDPYPPNPLSIVWHVANSNGNYTITNKQYGQCVAYTTPTPSAGDFVQTSSSATYQWIIRETTVPGQYIISSTNNNTLYWGLASPTATVQMTATSDDKAKWNFMYA